APTEPRPPVMRARSPITRPCTRSTSWPRCRSRSWTGRTRSWTAKTRSSSCSRRHTRSPRVKRVSPRRSHSAEVDHHVLELGIVRQRLDPLLAAEAASLVAAKGEADAALDAVAVDADLSRLDRGGHRQRLAQVRRPYPGHQSIGRAVGDLDRLVDRPEGGHGQHRTKN